MGINYSEKLIPAISKEVAKAVIAKYSAQNLLSDREEVSKNIKQVLKERLLEFNIIVEEVAITAVSFSREFEKSVEEKQIAQQNAERMKYAVEKAKEVKKTAIIVAEKDVRSIELIGKAMQESPAYLTLKKLETAQQISDILSKSQNRVILNSEQLQMNSLNILDK